VGDRVFRMENKPELREDEEGVKEEEGEEEDWIWSESTILTLAVLVCSLLSTAAGSIPPMTISSASLTLSVEAGLPCLPTTQLLTLSLSLDLARRLANFSILFVSTLIVICQHSNSPLLSLVTVSSSRHDAYIPDTVSIFGHNICYILYLQYLVTLS